MTAFETKLLPVDADVIAPDGSEVRILLRRPGGSMAHFRLGRDQVSKAVVHRTVEEIWYVLSGRGQMWRMHSGIASVTELHPGVSVTIPVGTSFQFRTLGDATLEAIAVTMPPWPGEGDANVVTGEWSPTVD